MARRPPSRRSLSEEDNNNASRRTSIESQNPNVFSDDYAVDHDVSFADLGPRNSNDGRPEELSVDRAYRLENGLREYTAPGLPGHLSMLNRLSGFGRSMATDASAEPHRAISISSCSIADTRRTLSSSSRFSIPRTQSPYRGPTAPSQPYGLYPQITRSSSIASESTIRPVERPFIPQSGPEHPYSMYPQNTVPEEDVDQDMPFSLGFPRIGQSFPAGTDSSGDDVGDIVGSDGHIEQLPAYSRYADNVIAKGDMARIDQQRASLIGDSRSVTLVQSRAPSAASDVELTAVGSANSMDEAARKEGFVHKKMKKLKRTCCGLPIWAWAILFVVVALATILGGVIGGVVGNERGTDRALASGATTTTVWLDADPAQTGPYTPPCPTGHWTLPLNKTQEIDTCVVDSSLPDVWSCMGYAKLGINVFESGTNGGPPLSVVFDDYSVRPQLFRYGPQPPDFNGTAFAMQPYIDKEDSRLGVGLFFSVLFDKLSILPENALHAPGSSGSKRSVPMSDLTKRGSNDPPSYLNIGDQPWYCFWNSTINEFWIFLDEYSDGSNTSTVSSVSSKSTSPPVTTSHGVASSTASGGTSASSPMYMTPAATSFASMTSPAPSETTSNGYWNGSKKKRQTSGGGSTDFPKLVKMLEKRKPSSNVPPYCQQMQVLNNWQIMPIPNIPTVAIEEKDYAAATSGVDKRAVAPEASDTTQELSSNCYCEWFSA